MGISDDIRPFKKPIHQHIKENDSQKVKHKFLDDFAVAEENKKIPTPVETLAQEKPKDIDREIQAVDKVEKTEIKVNEKETTSHDSNFADNFFINFEKDKLAKKIPAKSNKKEINPNIPKVFAWIIWIIFLTFISFVIYKNLNNIKNLFITDQTVSSTTEEGDDSNIVYDGEIETPNETKTENTITENSSPYVEDEKEEVAIDKSKILIKVLNGNGVANSANAIKATLTKAGFNISATSNAKSYSYLKTYIYYKTDKDQEAVLVADALKDRQIVKENNNTVCGTYDIVVVVGKQ